MVLVLLIFLIVFFFELRSLIKAKEKKEAALYIVLAAFAVTIGVFMLLVPDYTSFSDMMLNLLNISH